jgi:hypothetical protein
MRRVLHTEPDQKGRSEQDEGDMAIPCDETAVG